MVHKQEDGAKITANSVNPGAIPTNIFRHYTLFSSTHDTSSPLFFTPKKLKKMILPLRVLSVHNCGVQTELFVDINAGLVNIFGKLVLKNVQQVIDYLLKKNLVLMTNSEPIAQQLTIKTLTKLICREQQLHAMQHCTHKLKESVASILQTAI